MLRERLESLRNSGRADMRGRGGEGGRRKRYEGGYRVLSSQEVGRWRRAMGRAERQDGKQLRFGIARLEISRDNSLTGKPPSFPSFGLDQIGGRAINQASSAQESSVSEQQKRIQ